MNENYDELGDSSSNLHVGTTRSENSNSVLTSNRVMQDYERDQSVTKEDYVQDLLDRLTDLRRKMENKEVTNLFSLPFSILMMTFVLIMYPNMLVVPVISVFIAPSLLLNTWFVFASKSS